MRQARTLWLDLKEISLRGMERLDDSPRIEYRELLELEPSVPESAAEAQSDDVAGGFGRFVKVVEERLRPRSRRMHRDVLPVGLMA